MRKYSKKWVLQDTINFYTLENRAVGCGSNCQYLTEDGRKCAIGRYLKKGQEEDLKRCIDPVQFLMESWFFETSIPKWMRKLPLLFLREIQILHDNRDNWTPTGLSKKGINTVHEICEVYNISFDSLTIKQ